MVIAARVAEMVTVEDDLPLAGRTERRAAHCRADALRWDLDGHDDAALGVQSAHTKPREPAEVMRFTGTDAVDTLKLPGAVEPF
jgi:hypothetical protein